jgi:hypothetical protein
VLKHSHQNSPQGDDSSPSVNAALLREAGAYVCTRLASLAAFTPPGVFGEDWHSRLGRGL